MTAPSNVVPINRLGNESTLTGRKLTSTPTGDEWRAALAEAKSADIAVALIAAAPLGNAVVTKDPRDTLNHGTAWYLIDIVHDKSLDDVIRDAARVALATAFPYAMHKLTDPELKPDQWLNLLTDERFCRELREPRGDDDNCIMSFLWLVHAEKTRGMVSETRNKIINDNMSAIVSGLMRVWLTYDHLETEGNRESVFRILTEALPYSTVRMMLDQLKRLALSTTQQWPHENPTNLWEAAALHHDDPRGLAARIWFDLKNRSRIREVLRKKEYIEQGKRVDEEEIKLLEMQLAGYRQYSDAATRIPEIEASIARLKAKLNR